MRTWTLFPMCLKMGVLFRTSLALSGWVSRWHLGLLPACQSNSSVYSPYQLCLCALSPHMAGNTNGRDWDYPQDSLFLANSRLELTVSIPTVTVNIHHHHCPVLLSLYSKCFLLLICSLLLLWSSGCCLEDSTSKTSSIGYKAATLDIMIKSHFRLLHGILNHSVTRKQEELLLFSKFAEHSVCSL